MRTTTDEILAEEERLDNDRMDRLQRSAARQTWTLIGGGIAFLGTTLVLVASFSERRDQTAGGPQGQRPPYRARERDSLPPLAGSDEIAEVDRAFHDMATSLDQQKQENEMFVYSVSHDLRSPLINLQGFSEELSLSYRDLQGPVPA